jgi:hypothetical protein
VNRRALPVESGTGLSGWELAQLDVAEMRGPLDSPAMADFVSNLDRINATAEGSDGFNWSLKTDDVDASKAFVYRSAHASIMRRRRECFDAMRQAYMVLWWVPTQLVQE